MIAPTLLRARATGFALLVAIAVALSLAAPAKAEYSDAQLEAFVTAAITVESLAQQWIARIEKAESEDAAAALRGQANAQVQEAIDAIDGMTVAEYREINAAARQDQTLAGRIVEIYRQKKAQ